MTSNEIRTKFLEFFKSKGHTILPSASLIPQGDSSVLFTTAGMQPLVPYLLGEKHPSGTRLASVQKCLRTGDIDDIGDNRHLTFFEMLGNWSLGDYFKNDSITWSYEFLTDKNIGLGLDPARLYITCFEGDADAPRDTESAEIWTAAGIPESRIYFLGKDDNWWGPGDNGPCGPDTEIFYDVTGSLGELSKESFVNAVKSEFAIEIWNNVFMEYRSEGGKVVGKLDQKNVDTGMGLERITAVVNGLDNVYETDLFKSLIVEVDNLSDLKDKNPDTVKLKRIIADHIRSSIFLLSDGVLPGNTGQGYILRRLLRKQIRCAHALTMNNDYESLFSIVENSYKDSYPNIGENREKIIYELKKEFNKFIQTLSNGLKALENGTDPFILATTFGFPIELTIEENKRKGKEIDLEDFNKKMSEHQKLSQTSSAGMFKGGLANHNEATIKLHTAHHLLLAALQSVLGAEVKQRGSNITEERLRIDFSFDRKMTDEEKKKVEDIVNNGIRENYKVVRREMSKDEAEGLGAQMEFGAKYGDTVSVYFIEDEKCNAVSKEFCGGPHVEHTGGLGIFKILKEEASSQGVRRIKAILE